tara:strand:+ start:21080 stop:21208 length:129 start_codon:yes stop_codon:yes gene_type:complete
LFVNYFVFKASSGDLATWVKFGSKENAAKAHQELSRKIASED